MYIFSLVGMQFFANRFRFDANGVAVPLDDPNHATSDQPRAHFDTLGWALITIFQLLSGENWNTVMYDGIRAGGVGAAFYFIVMVILGDFIILNLFLAILLTNFDGLDEAQKEETENNEHYEANDDGTNPKPKCCGLCGNSNPKNNTKVAPAEPTTAASSDEAWNFARRDDVVFQTGEEKTTDPNSSNAETDGTTSGDNDLDDDFASLDTTDPDGGDMQQMGTYSKIEKIEKNEKI